MRITDIVSSTLLSPLLIAQAFWVRRRTPRLPEPTGPRAGVAGPDTGAPLRLWALGDSIIAGVGVGDSGEALPARLAAALADRLGVAVQWTSQGRSGARTADLLGWAWDPASRHSDLVLLSNGLNDVTAPVTLDSWLRQKDVLYDRLRLAAPGALLVQLGLPPLGDFPALPHPLRGVLGRRARRFDIALEKRRRDDRALLYLPFRQRPDPGLFASDGYHPGPEAIALWAASLAEPIAQRLEATSRLRSPATSEAEPERGLPEVPGE